MHEIRIYSGHPDAGGKIRKRISPQMARKLFWDGLEKDHVKKSKHSQYVAANMKRKKKAQTKKEMELRAHFAVKNKKVYRQLCKTKGIEVVSKTLNRRLVDNVEATTCAHCLKKLKAGEP